MHPFNMTEADEEQRIEAAKEEVRKKFLTFCTFEKCEISMISNSSQYW